MLLSHARNYVEEAERLLEEIQAILNKEYPPRSEDFFTVGSNEIIDDEIRLERYIQQAALELRMGCEMAAYRMLEGRRKYFNESYFDSWQADKVISFISDVIQENFSEDAIHSVCRSGHETDPNAWQVIGETKGIKKKEFRKIYHALGSLLHVFEDLSGFPKQRRIKNQGKAIEIISGAIDYFRSFKGKMDAHFHAVVNIRCTCGHALSRPTHMIEKENFIECDNKDCGQEWKVRQTDKQNFWKKEMASITVQCPACNLPIPVPRKTTNSMRKEIVRLNQDFLPTDKIVTNLVCLNKECIGSIDIVLGWHAAVTAPCSVRP